MARKLPALLFCAVLTGLLVLPAHAAPEDYVVTNQGLTDAGYSGPLDPKTGLPLSDNSTGFTSSGTRYVLRPDEYGYDRNTGRYYNLVGNNSFSSTVPNGSVLPKNKTVGFTIPSGMTATLFRNGDPMTDVDLNYITETGNYVLEVKSANSSDAVAFRFRIIPDLVNSLPELTLPDGFSFDYVTQNSESLTLDHSNYIQFLSDGSYSMSWSCPDIGQQYSLSFTLDTQPPVLELPEIQNGQAWSEVTVTVPEDAASVLIQQEGASSRNISSQTTLKEPGTYTLTVLDQAGNSAQYTFTIHVYLNLSALAGIGLLLAGATALWLYSHYIKKHPRVG